MKLFSVRTKMPVSYTIPSYDVFYIVAESFDDASKMVAKFFDEKNIGFLKDRTVHSITVLAEAKDYPLCGTILLLEQ